MALFDWNDYETTMTPPAAIYLAMGVVIAIVLLEGSNTKGLSVIQWLQFLVNALRIVLLWPLVLFVEKVEKWLKPPQ